ncbi:MAG: DUF416 family protein [Bacteroidota bacterium]
MKIFDFIKIFRHKPKATKSADPEFPMLEYKEFALLRAERNTGIVLNERLEYANRDHGTMFKKFSNLESSITTAREIVNTNPTVEVCVYDHKQQVVYFIDVENEKFHNADLEFDFHLKQRIADSSDDKLLNFALDICKRLLPEYIRFYEKHQWGDPNALIDAIGYCESAKPENLQQHILKDFLERVDLVTPDTEDFGDYEGSYALNASTSTMALLTFLIDGNKDSILESSSYMTDNADAKLGEAYRDLTYKELETHPDMVAERQYQLRLLN